MRKTIYRYLAALLMLCQLMAYLPAAAEDVVVASAKLRTASNVQDGMVRVLLSSMGYPTALDITLSGAFVADGAQDVELPAGARISVSMNTSTGELTLKYGSAQYGMGKTVALRRRATEDANGFKIAQAKKSGNLYPGDLYLSARTSGNQWRLHPVAHVYIEYYLHGVLPYEMGNSAPLEALKAQAVAARTFTLRRMNTSNTLYDLTDTTSDQVYYGNSDNTARCTQAVNETKGISLMVDGRLAATYYTASNGGQTESVANAWGSSGYTESIVRDDPFDFQSTASTVKSGFIYKNNQHSSQPDALKKLLNQKASALTGQTATVQRINAISLHSPKYDAPSRLYTKMTLSVTAESNGREFPLDVTCDVFGELEAILGISINSGSNELWSVTEESSAFRISARRYGHGIGMSQRGAMQMATLGYTYDRILGFYYNESYRMQNTFSHTILESVGNSTITTTEKPADITTSDAVTATVTLTDTNSTVNVRAAASENAVVRGTLPHGAQVIIIANDGTWCEVKTAELEGYIKAEFLTYNTDEEPYATPSPEVPAVIGYAYVTTPSGSLNLRSAADSDSLILAQIPRMTKVPLYETKSGWACVLYNGQKGWVMTSFLTMTGTENPDADSKEEGNETAKVTGGGLNLRAAPSTAARLFVQIPDGTIVNVIEKSGAWSKTTYRGYTGWVMSKYLTFAGNDGDNGTEEDSATPTPTPTPTPDHPGYTDVRTAKVVGGGLNLRQSASTSARILIQIPDNMQIQVYETVNGWSRTSYRGNNGWVMAKYLQFVSGESATSTPTPTPTPTDTSAPENETPPAESVTARVTGGKLNMRLAPESNAYVMQRIPDGTVLTVTERGAVWCKVQYNGQAGFVMTRYLSFGEQTMMPQARVVTVSGGLNLREKPESGSHVLMQIPRGSLVSVHQKLSGWCLVSYRNNSGYVMTKYLSFVNGSTDSTAPAEKTNSPDVATPTPTPTIPAATAGDEAWINVSSGTLNLRRTAGGSTVLALLQNRVPVTVLEYGNDWTRIQVASLTGYVQTQYLTWTKPTASPEGALRLISTGNGSLNLRNDARDNANVILTIPDGASIRLMEYRGTWSRISYQGVTGYVKSVYLTDDAPATENAGSAVYDPTLKRTENALYVVVRSDLNSVNVRQWCSTNAPVDGLLQKGVAATVLEMGDTWCRIQLDQQLSGYCMLEYLTVFAAD